MIKDFLYKFLEKQIEENLLEDFRKNRNSLLRKEVDKILIAEFHDSINLTEERLGEIYEIADTPGFNNLIFSLRNQKFFLSKKTLVDDYSEEAVLKTQGGAKEITKFLRFLKNAKKMAKRNLEREERKNN